MSHPMVFFSCPHTKGDDIVSVAGRNEGCVPNKNMADLEGGPESERIYGLAVP